MDPKLVYWTWAVANFVAVVVLALMGVAQIRRGNVLAHRRRMLGSASLVGLFVGSYVVKLFVLGREDRSVWSATSLAVLYAHELCIAAMLIAGGYAAYRAWRFFPGMGPNPSLETSNSKLRERVQHRRAGWTAVVASALGCALAFGVLFGMYARAA